ncbi:NAD-dependent epimerase/dehydratase family protein [Neolewinella aurantiaca]|uniref:NAD-dependent epimerase/dehydratase family protein n=1 Tax=Neolewinella aurantiaca TaxID=2602767 RepID=A0A5C7FJQ9_9BACT|nr:NAD-dependent epimerase/dehydratase family protein [Neolewinella aurantiaca]TXF90884.1 NAD-dependent epimerase/dehydratase family protein [Neolewinella aurantiaca]
MNIILTGSTGMVGKSVLLECLDSPAVNRVMLINRNPLGKEHPKLIEVLHQDFTDFTPLQQQIRDFSPQACFHCMGVSSVGMNEETYSRLTLQVTKSLADVVYTIAPQTVFTYVSGEGTDETEKGNIMWARVKGATENYVLNKGFGDAYAFRIGAVIPERGVKSSTGWVNAVYTITKPLHGWLKGFSSVVSSSQLGQAMILVAQQPTQVKRLENKDIKRLVA